MLSNRDGKNIWKILSIYVLITLIACTVQSVPPVNPYNTVPAQGPTYLKAPGSTPTTIITSISSPVSVTEQVLPPVSPYTDAGGTTVTPNSTTNFATGVSFAPSDAKYFDLVNTKLNFTPAELTLLKQNGFFVSDRLAFTDFTTAYAYIYWRDLPVLVTTDSILQSIHQTYDDLLIHVEEGILSPKLNTLLTETRKQVQLASLSNTDSNLQKMYSDLQVYLTVPLVLLSEENGKKYDTPEIDPYVKLAEAADTVIPTGLFNNQGEVDFTQFKPRGHYTKYPELKHYFRAMSWLAHIDFPVVAYTPAGDPVLNNEALIAAHLLRDAIKQSGQRPEWDKIDILISSLVGRSDNMTLPDLDRFLNDAGIHTPSELINYPKPDQIIQLLITEDYGQQRITGQILGGGAYSPDPINRPISFTLFGQRFSIDSYLMSNLVYDRLLVNGKKVERPLPSPLDIMYVLGNDRAAAHLQDELNKYRYAANLASLRTTVDHYEPVFWSGNVYSRWLDLLRKLNTVTTAKIFPQTMRTAAWADKILHTQLASWAQLRHDNILYTKQSYTTSYPVCEYPAGYVEPYPAFFAAVQDYANFGQTLLNYLNPNDLTKEGRATYQTAAKYFSNLATIARQLQTLAEKELRLEPFTKDEELFLKSIAIRQLEEVDNICAKVIREEWNGWYLDLFPWRDDNPALIADIHTNPNTAPEYPALLPPSVLHIGTGPAAALVFLVDTDEGVTAYVGPAFTYFETIEEGFPPKRLTDEDWNKRLTSDPRPAPPAWTSSFRIPSSSVPAYLELPKKP